MNSIIIKVSFSFLYMVNKDAIRKTQEQAECRTTCTTPNKIIQCRYFTYIPFTCTSDYNIIPLFLCYSLFSLLSSVSSLLSPFLFSPLFLDLLPFYLPLLLSSLLSLTFTHSVFSLSFSQFLSFPPSLILSLPLLLSISLLTYFSPFSPSPSLPLFLSFSLPPSLSLSLYLLLSLFVFFFIGNQISSQKLFCSNYYVQLLS